MSKEAFYFKHFNNARNDRKIQRAIMQLGIEAYALYFMTIEVLREQSNLKYPLCDIDILAHEFRTSTQKLEVIITNYGLFKIDEKKMFFSQALLDGLQSWRELKELNSLKGKASAKARKKKAEAQLSTFSREDSIQPRLNSGETTVQLREEKKREEKKNIENDSTTKKKIESFSKFVSWIRMSYPNMKIIKDSSTIDKDLTFMKGVKFSVSTHGRLYNTNSTDDFSPAEADLIWNWLHANQEQIKYKGG